MIKVGPHQIDKGKSIDAVFRSVRRQAMISLSVLENPKTAEALAVRTRC
jgi:hypothetical protein